LENNKYWLRVAKLIVRLPRLSEIVPRRPTSGGKYFVHDRSEIDTLKFSNHSFNLPEMAVSSFASTQLYSDEFVESAGAVLFNLSTKMICLVRLATKEEWLLPKGRRNCGESRQHAALREAREETGYNSRIMPVNMSTRSPPAIESQEYPDEPREFDHIAEPFVLTVRQLGPRNQKLIWWYIATVDDLTPCAEVHPGDEKFQAMFFPYATAVDLLTFEHDKEIVRRAIELVTATFPTGDSGNDLVE
jgi:8-oxo-dGTP pyrophosphatase MutT (NUDIX family)